GGLFLVRSNRDAVALGTVYLAALFGISAKLVFPGAGGVGTPAMAVAIVAAWWWWMAKANSDIRSDTGFNPVRVALICYLWIVAFNWGISRVRPLSALEANGSNRALITAIALAGLALLICDGVRDRPRLETFLKRVVVAGALLSVVAILQFAGAVDVETLARIPGLVANDEIGSLANRAGLNRAEGTTLHSIELSAVLAMIAPLAVHFAMRGKDQKERRRYMIMALVIGAGVPLSVSRTGLLALVVGLLVTSVAWTWRQRWSGFAVAGVAAVLLGLAIPGLVGTFRWFIFNAGNDTSVTARVDRLPRALDEISKNPWFGSGVGTFSADEDFLLDNQVLETLIEMGVIGTLVVLGLIGTAITMCVLTYRRASDEDVRRLSMAVCAMVVVLPVVMTTFDAFFYHILMGVSFLMIGASGALWRIAVRDAATAKATFVQRQAAVR
ncbi:MAG TPA: O-antigen ligase family protein, partial [Acidimicrobiia bacterium]|nr:O-antigen ligase family protein [Acidimicrobiia bacterium]